MDQDFKCSLSFSPYNNLNPEINTCNEQKAQRISVSDRDTNDKHKYLTVDVHFFLPQLFHDAAK